MTSWRRAARGLLGAAAMIAVVTVLSRVLGLVRVLVQAGTVGADAIGDAYSAANILPNILFEAAAGGALAGAVVPLLAGPVAAVDREQVSRTTSAALGWTLTVLVPLGALLALASGAVAQVVSGDPGTVALVRYLVVVFSVQVPLYGVTVLLYGVLQSHRRFFWPAFAPVLNSLVVVTAFVVYGALADGETVDPARLPAGAVDVLAWGTTAGVAAMCLPMLWPVHRLGVRVRPSWRFPEGTGRRFRSLAVAGVGSVVAQQVSVAVVLWLATSRLPGDGQGYATYTFAQQVYLLPYAVLVVPLATSTFPRIAAHVAAADRPRLAHLSAVTTRAVLVAGVTGGAAVLAGGPAVATVFASIAGQPGVAVGMTSTLTWMAPGVVGLGLLFHVSRTLYALERSRSAVLVNAVGWATVAVVATALVSFADADGVLAALGQATTVGMTAGAAAAVLALRRAVGPEASAGTARTLVVSVGAGAVGSLAGRWVAGTAVALVGDGALSATAAAAGGAVVAAAAVVAAVALLDRSTLTGVTRAGQTAGALVRPAGDD